MRVDLLGWAAGCPGPHAACSGYLVEAAGRRVLLDCGPGTAGPLQRRCPPGSLDGVVVTHMHADHWLDLVPLAYGALADWSAPGAAARPLRVWVPTGGLDVLAATGAAMGHDRIRLPAAPGRGPAYDELRERAAATGDFALAVLDVVEFEPGDAWALGGLLVRTWPVDHGVTAAAVRLDHDGAALAYSGDTRPCDGVVEAARSCSVLLADSAGGAVPGSAHLSATEAGGVAAAAGAGRLVLTHLAAGADPDRLAAEAAVAYRGPIAVAPHAPVMRL